MAAASVERRVLIVDDEPNLVDAVRLYLEMEGYVILTAMGGQEALDKLRDLLPDLVILDVMMPGMDGFETLREIRHVSDVPVIMLTARGEETDQVRGLEMGADDYVVKPFSHFALIARIKAVLRRAEMPPVRELPDFVAGPLAVDFRASRVTLHGEPVKLTPVEYKLLYHLVRNAGRLMPHQALLDRVWGDEYGATTDYLKVFISRLRAKIEPEGGPHFIETERGLGYRFVDFRQGAKATTPR